MDDTNEKLNISPAAIVGTSPPPAANGGTSPPMADIGDVSLTTEEVRAMWRQEYEIVRHERSIERYCEQGRLKCFKDPDENRWYVSEKSAKDTGDHFKQIENRHAVRRIPVQSEPPPQPPSPSDTADNHKTEESGEHVRELEDKIREQEGYIKLKEQVEKSLMKQITTFADKMVHYVERAAIAERDMKHLLAAPHDQQRAIAIRVTHWQSGGQNDHVSPLGGEPEMPPADEPPTESPELRS